MKNKMRLVVAAAFGLAMMGLQGCFYSSPSPVYGGGYYGRPAYSGPAYRTYGSNVTGCNPRNSECMVCDSDGHHCHAVVR
jgi:hypothetical protein